MFSRKYIHGASGSREAGMALTAEEREAVEVLRRVGLVDDAKERELDEVSNGAKRAVLLRLIGEALTARRAELAGAERSLLARVTRAAEPESVARYALVTFRVSDEEKLELEARAAATGFSVSEYCRRFLFGELPA